MPVESVFRQGISLNRSPVERLLLKEHCGFWAMNGSLFHAKQRSCFVKPISYTTAAFTDGDDGNDCATAWYDNVPGSWSKTIRFEDCSGEPCDGTETRKYYRDCYASGNSNCKDEDPGGIDN